MRIYEIGSFCLHLSLHLEPECGLARSEGGKGEKTLHLGLVHRIQRAVDKAATKHLREHNSLHPPDP